MKDRNVTVIMSFCITVKDIEDKSEVLKAVKQHIEANGLDIGDIDGVEDFWD